MRRLSLAAPRLAVWLLVFALLPSLAFTARIQAAAGTGPRHGGTAVATQSYDDGAEHDGDVRQCTPEAATCSEVPAFSAAAVMSLAGDVIAAVASDSWVALAARPPVRSRDVAARPPTDPPRLS